MQAITTALHIVAGFAGFILLVCLGIEALDYADKASFIRGFKYAHVIEKLGPHEVPIADPSIMAWRREPIIEYPVRVRVVEEDPMSDEDYRVEEFTVNLSREDYDAIKLGAPVENPRYREPKTAESSATAAA